MTTKYFHKNDLHAVRTSCDWRRLLVDLGVREDVKKSTAGEVWAFSPFNENEKTASFHMKQSDNGQGIWYDWSSKISAPNRTKAGGGVIELVQCIHASRGRIMKLNEAASWLIENGYSQLCEAVEVQAPPLESSAVQQKPLPLETAASNERVAASPASGERKKENTPINIDLFPKLSQLGTHAEFKKRDVSTSVCEYLRCGYLQGGRGTLANKLVFQIAGVQKDARGHLERVILSHMARATAVAGDKQGKWQHFKGFNKSLALYNIDNLLLDGEAAAQVKENGEIMIVEGAFDVAKCVAASIKNVVACFGSSLSDAQAESVARLAGHFGGVRIKIFFDRDVAGQAGATQTITLLQKRGLTASVFDWNQVFTNSNGEKIFIPTTINDPCDFSVKQLKWMVG